MAPTRWTVKSGSIGSILSNYKPLLETFEESFRAETNTEMKARSLTFCTVYVFQDLFCLK